MSKPIPWLRAMWCRLRGHVGRETIYTHETAGGVTTTTLARETCLGCGRRLR